MNGMEFCIREVLVEIYPSITVHVTNCSAKLRYHFVFIQEPLREQRGEKKLVLNGVFLCIRHLVRSLHALSHVMFTVTPLFRGGSSLK